MGFSVSEKRVLLQYIDKRTSGMDPDQKAQYFNLKDQVCKQFGPNPPAEYLTACQIMSKDLNSSIDDVMKLYEQTKNMKSDGSQNTYLVRFNAALKKVPGFSSAKLTASNILELESIYRSSCFAQAEGLTPEQTFIQNAKAYLESIIDPNVETDNNTDEQQTEQTDDPSIPFVYKDTSRIQFLADQNISIKKNK